MTYEPDKTIEKLKAKLLKEMQNPETEFDKFKKHFLQM